MKKFNVTAAAISLIAASIICFTSGEEQLKKPRCTECGFGVAADLKYTARHCTADQDSLCCKNPTDMDIGGECQDRQGEIIDRSSSSVTETADGITIAIGLITALLVIGAMIIRPEITS